MEKRTEEKKVLGPEIRERSEGVSEKRQRSRKRDEPRNF